MRDDDPVAFRRVVTAEDVLRLVREGVAELAVGPDDRFTSLARDLVREKGVRVVVRDAAGRGGGPAPGPDVPALPPVASRSGPARRLTHVADVLRLTLDPFPVELGRPAMDVRLRDVVTARDGLPMAAGVMSLREGSFPWHLDYDEVEYVLEGELHITTPDQKVVGRPGDVIAVPKGSSITFGTPSWAKFLYVTYPADWSGA